MSSTKAQWIPTESDLIWTRDLLAMLRTGGMWACPAGDSVWQKDSDNSVTLLEGDPDDETNSRILICLRTLGFIVAGSWT